MREMARAPAHFPDAFVRLAPDGLEVQDERAFESPARIARGEPRATRDIKGVEHFAIDVELKLTDGAVADADRARAFVARQPRKLVFLEPPLARDAVDDLQVVR
jgi:hypothetical protein